MNHRLLRRVALSVLLLFSLLALAKDKNAPEQFSEVTFTVVRDSDGKPLDNVSVVLHTIDSKGRLAHGGFQLKTNKEGSASMAAVPYGRLRVQVLIVGYQTYGQDVDINQPKQSLEIRLKPPTDQYSIYK